SWLISLRLCSVGDWEPQIDIRTIGVIRILKTQRNSMQESKDEVLDILYNDDSGDDLIPELDSNSDSESDNEAYRTDIIHELKNLFVSHTRTRPKVLDEHKTDQTGNDISRAGCEHNDGRSIGTEAKVNKTIIKIGQGRENGTGRIRITGDRCTLDPFRPGRLEKITRAARPRSALDRLSFKAPTTIRDAISYMEKYHFVVPIYDSPLSTSSVQFLETRTLNSLYIAETRRMFTPTHLCDSEVLLNIKKLRQNILFCTR
ncbi:hypothetical protein C0J52_27496, partial [Blattella germanica]